MSRKWKIKQPWSDSDVEQLRQLAAEKVPTRDIAKKLKRTANAVRHKAREEGITLAGIRRGRGSESSN